MYRNDRCYGDTDRNRKGNQRKGAEYILALKENQKTLYEDVRLFIEEYRKNPEGIGPDCCAASHSQGHGRYESRTCYISEEIGWLAGREKGIGVIFCHLGSRLLFR